MEMKRITAKELAEEDPASIVGTVEIDGFLVFRSHLEAGWIAADDEDAEPVVMLATDEKVLETLQRNVGVLGGGRFIYINSAKVVGTIVQDEDKYVLTNIAAIDIWDGPELVRLSLG